MKKLILTAVFTAICFMTSAQVGIGTTNPETTLHVVGANATGTTNTPGALNAVDGIAVPVVTDDMTTTTTNGTKVSQLVYSNNAASTGFYFWNGTAWVAMMPTDVTLGAVTDVSIPTNATYDIPSTGSVFNLINGAAFGGPTVRLPPATPANVGKLLVIINTNSTTTINLANVGGNNTQFGGGKSGIFVSNGTTWIAVVED